MADIFLLSGLTPSGVRVWPKNSLHHTLTVTYLNVSVKLNSFLSGPLHQSQLIFIMLSVSGSIDELSSAVPVTPGRPSRALSSSF